MTSVTIEISDDELERMKSLAARSGRSVDDVLRQVVEGGITAQEEAEGVVAGIKRGLADVEAGRLVPASQVSDRIDEVLAKLRAK
jgi:predicted transcriptional regulator